MDKRQLVPTNGPRCIISLAIDDDILKKYSVVVKWQAVGSNCSVQAAVNRCEGVTEADLVGEEAVGV
jgi:hypothetical protein